jgi:hypothetical protein
MTVGELLDRTRSHYLAQLTRSWADARRRPGVDVVTEVVLCDVTGAAVREGVWSLPCRLDTCLLQNGEVVDSSMVGTERLIAFAPLEFEWSSGLSVRLAPFPWDYCELRLGSPLSGPAHFRAWFDRWFDAEDSHPEDAVGFRGVVHFMSDPEVGDGVTRLLVDFGSAPVEAFEQLLDAAVASGQTSVQIGQPGE